MFFMVRCTVLERAKSFDGSFLGPYSWEGFHTLSELKKYMRAPLEERFKKQINLFRHQYFSDVDPIGRPEFIWCSYYDEPIRVEVRMISPKEYHYMKRQEQLEDQAMWEAYGERKLGC